MARDSINFDRAASYYDATRVLPDDIAAATTGALLDQIRRAGAGRVLEVGIGTGRMARPLMRHGVRVVGVDISRQMMAQLRSQLTPEHRPPALLLGDATLLPLLDETFKAVMVVHVFHVVSSIDASVAEIKRVLAPGGVLLHQTGRPSERTRRFWNDNDQEWEQLLAARGSQRRLRARDPEPVHRALEAAGGRATIVEVAQSREAHSVDDELERLRRRTHSWTWQLPAEIFDSALSEYERWLRSAVPGGSWTDEVTLVLEVWRWD
jgi:SAM-dependent methyltransferase